jgi:hypothetical protein
MAAQLQGMRRSVKPMKAVYFSPSRPGSQRRALRVRCTLEPYYSRGGGDPSTIIGPIRLADIPGEPRLRSPLRALESERVQQAAQAARRSAA